MTATPSDPASRADASVAAPGRLASSGRAPASGPRPLGRLAAPRDAAVPLVLASLCIALFLAAPVGGDFSNADAPRHALNGVFLRDFAVQHPFAHPFRWAVDYYLQWPALSFGFYPPAFSAVEALFYGVFGVSHAVAQATVTLFCFVLGCSAYRLGRSVLSPPAALAAAVLLLGAPAMTLWERQVMLDVPAQAMMVLGLVFVARFCETGRTVHLVCAGLGLLVALNTKFETAFIAVPAAVAVGVARGWRVFLARRMLAMAALGAVGVAPALLMLFYLGKSDWDNVAGLAAGHPVLSVARWSEYAGLLPSQLGWPVLLLAVPGAALLWRRTRSPGRRWIAALMLTWFVFGYAFFSAIRQHEPRHDLYIVFPLVLCAATALDAALSRLSGRLAPVAAVLAFAITVGATPVRRVTGYAEIADYVARTAPPGTVILSSAFRDGNLIFDLRTHADRTDLHVIRANKLILKFAVDRTWGVVQASYDRAGLLRLLQERGVGLVVAQRRFWTDLGQMALLETLLNGPDFRKVASFPIAGGLDPDDGGGDTGANTVDLFVPVVPPSGDPSPLTLDVPFLGGKVTRSADP